MNDLTVIDVSAVVYTGSLSSFHEDRRFYGYPVGGIHYLMRQIAVAFTGGDFVTLCFDSPSFRNELNPNYKSGRARNQEVVSQIETLYDGLMRCGIMCEKFDGFEADDIVEWAVAQNCSKFPNITIVGNDYDLCHSIRQNVLFKSIAKGVGCIYPANFSESVDPSGPTLFNTISAKKALKGCKSDKISGIKLENGIRGSEVYAAYVKFLQDNYLAGKYELTSSWKQLLAFAKKSGLFTQRDWENLCKNIKLVYPAECPEGVKIHPSAMAGVNKNELAHFLTMYNDQESLKCLGLHRVSLFEDDKQKVRDKARAICNGEYAADRNLERESLVNVSTLELDSFTRDF